MTAFSVYLFPRIETETSPLAMRPLQIANLSVPVVDGDGGININAVEDSPAGLLCAIPAYNPMQAGDKHDVYWGGKKVFDLEVQPDEVDKPLFFFLPIAPVLETLGWVEPVYYQLTRNGASAPEPPSSELRLLVKLDRPAGVDTDPHLPGHSHLKPVLLPEDVIRDGVSAERAKNGVPLTVEAYRGIALRDSVAVQWGTVWMAPHRVNQAQAEGREPIVITADQATILAAGDSVALTVRYDVYDQVNNFAVEMSKTASVLVEAGETKLEAPIIKNADDGIIDLELLDKEDVTVYVRTRPADFDLGDTVMLTWTSVPREGRPLYHTGSKTVDETDSILELYVPYDIVRAAAMGSASVFYALNKADGSPPIRSHRAYADVIGDIWLLPQPVIREVLGDTLEPSTRIATVDVAYPGMTNGDFINLIWLGQKSNGQPYVHEDQHTVSANEAAVGSIEFYVGSEHISVLADGSLDLSYRVSNDEMSSHGVSRSEHLLVRVGQMRGELPVPVVVEADPPDILDPTKVGDFVTVRVDYLGTAAGDILTCDWLGAGPGGSWQDSVPITTLTAGKRIPFRVRADYVITNIGRRVKVRYVLWRAATKRYSYSLMLDLLIGELVGELPPPDVLQAPDGDLNPMAALGGVDIEAGYESMNPALDVVALRWVGTPGAGSSVDLELPGHDSGSVQFHLPATVVGANIGRTVLVDYDVLRYGIRTPSEPRSVNVLSFQDPDTELPRPQVPEAVAGVLDLMETPGNATVTVGTWPFAAARQKAWLSLVGDALSGGSYVIELLKGEEISAAQAANGLRETLLRSELLKLAHDSAAVVVCKVAFDRSLAESDAIEFPRLPLRVRTRYDYLTPEITRVADSRGEVAEGGTTFDAELTLKGTGTRGERIELFDAGSLSMGIADVSADWQWERRIVNLTERLYSITATALYDAVPVSSDPRTFTANFAMPPIIDSVTDSKGPVASGGITFDTRVTFTGRANPDRQVQIYDEGTAVPPATPVDTDGNWTQELTGLAIATHAIKVRGLYGREPESAVHSFSVERAEPPIIESVKDSKGEIAPDGVTFETSVTLTGRAYPKQQVQIFNGSTAIAPATPVGDDGIWSRVLTGLAFAIYPIKVRALYGHEPESAIRTFEVAVTVTPAISSVKDSKGEVADGGQTFDTLVSLIGTASPNQQVQLYNGATAVPPVTTVKADGTWDRDLSGLTIATHTLKVKALYSTQPESAPHTFTVELAEEPTIKTVTDSKGELAPDGITFDDRVTLTGTANPNRQVQIYDGSTAVPPVTPVDNGGNWARQLTGLSIATHLIKVRGLYGHEPESAVRRFVVARAEAPVIQSVKDSKGEIVPNGVTFETSVTLTGTAYPNLQVQIFNGSTAIAPATTVGNDGIWSRVLTGLAIATYPIKVKALYGPGLESPVRTFEVALAVQPIIKSVRDSKGEVPNHGKTYETRVTLSGTANRNQQVQLYNGATAVAPVTTVKANGTWDRDLSGLTIATHTLKVKALYSTQPESAPHTFTVERAQRPEIHSVRDSKKEVDHNGLTYDNLVDLVGSGLPNEQVEIFDGSASKGKANIDGAGVWKHRLTGLAYTVHRITAKALYNANPVSSAERVFHVLQAVTPQITSVIDAKNTAIGNGGSTYQTSVTLSGPASPNERIQLRDNNTPIGNPITVPGGGTWTHTLTNLTRKTYQLTAKALYGNEPVSGVRSFTVAAMIEPSITSVVDSAGAHVSPNATTYQTSVTVTGGGTPGERITVLDGGASVRTVDVGANRVWSFVYSGLAAKYYNLTARAEYTVNPGTSGPWPFTVASHVAPQITSVKDSRGELANGGKTTDRTVSLTGQVTPSHQVQIYDNNVAGPFATANSSRTWSTNLSVGLGNHSITARAVTTGQTSGARTFTVESPIPPLNFNTNTVTLAGKVYMSPSGVLPNFDGSTSVHHVASGGIPPYTYASSNTAVAFVESNGRVTVRGKGQAYISVRDTANQSKQYLVIVTGAIQCLDLGAGTLSQITAAATAAGARVPSIAELREIFNAYNGRWQPGNAWYYWSNTVHSTVIVRRFYTKQMVGGGESPLADNLGHARGMGLR